MVVKLSTHFTISDIDLQQTIAIIVYFFYRNHVLSGYHDPNNGPLIVIDCSSKAAVFKTIRDVTLDLEKQH